jgi:hypothetical protein
MIMLRPRSFTLLAVAVAAACARHSGNIGGLVSGTPPAFETRTEVITGSGAHADYRIADFNGDGILDMAVISLTGEMRVLAGDGTNFVLIQELNLGGLPIWMSGGDIDSDGDQDLVVVRDDANSTDILLNDGTGNFVAGPSLPVGDDALAVALTDLNGDGNLDIAITRPKAPEIIVGFGDGNGNITSVAPIDLPEGGRPLGLAAGDVTRDGIADLVVADPDGNRVLVYPGGPIGAFGTSFRELVVPGAPAGVTLGDLSGDGQLDMVVSAFAANQYVVITDVLGPTGVGNQFDYQSFAVPVAGSPSLATVGDVTGDGLGDLIGSLAFTGSVVVVPQVAGGGVGEPFQLDTTGLPLRPFVGDFDRNGRNDLFTLSGLGNRVNLWFAKDTGELAGARNHASGLPGASWIEGGDFDGDGDFEVATCSQADSRLTILGRNAAGALVVESTIEVGLPIYQIESADLNGDRRNELVVGVPGGLRLLRNNSTPGNYQFELLTGSPSTIASGNVPFGIAVGDFDRDGDFDIALCDFVGGGVHVVPGTPQAFEFGQETVFQVGGGPVDVAAADFTGDGRLDLAVTRNTQSDIVVLRNEANGDFTQFLVVPVGETPNYLVASDFNRDGRADLVISNANSDSVSVLFGNPNGFAGQSYPAGDAPTALLARDLTGDGIDDILVTSLISGDFRVLVGDGTGNFPLLPTFPGTQGASDAVLQDMDGDGREDLLIASLVSNRISLVRNIRP